MCKDKDYYTVLSCFDGMSCGQLAIEDIPHLKEGRYFASEVDKYAIQVTQHNYPNTIQIGDVSKLVVKRFKSGLVKLVNEWGKKYYIDGKILLQGGSPCQGFSFTGKQLGSSTKCNIEVTTLEQYLKLKEEGFEFEGQSYLFWEYIRILREIKPDVFLLENVMMSKKWKDMFNDAVGVEPIMINSSLVSAQNRKRLYWTNIKDIKQPGDKGIVIADILEDDVDDKYYIGVETFNKIKRNSKWFNIYLRRSKRDKKPLIIYPDCLMKDKPNASYGKTGCLMARYGGHNCSENFGTDPFLISPEATKSRVRKLTPLECERLQTVPDNYTSIVSNSQRYKMLGNGWTINVISHIYSHL